jgi:hypothetical protein
MHVKPDTHAQQHGRTGEVSQVASSVAHTVEKLHAVPLAGDKSDLIAHAQTEKLVETQAVARIQQHVPASSAGVDPH